MLNEPYAVAATTLIRIDNAEHVRGIRSWRSRSSGPQ